MEIRIPLEKLHPEDPEDNPHKFSTPRSTPLNI